MQRKIKILWLLFFTSLLIPGVIILGDSLGLSLSELGLLKDLILYVPVISVLLHSIWTLSKNRGVLFILITCLTGFVFEYFGLKYGVLFGGDYIYSPEEFKILTVPLNVILYWGVFIYTGYCITNSFLFWLDRDKPSKSMNNGIMLPLLILFDSIIVVLLDLFMDPIQVRMGTWTWPDGGFYFGIPIGNFMGWIIVTAISTGMFRIYEYYNTSNTDMILKQVFIIPVLGYGLIYLSFFSLALKFEMLNLALVGTITMLPIVFLNVLFFRKYVRNKKFVYVPAVCRKIFY